MRLRLLVLVPILTGWAAAATKPDLVLHGEIGFQQNQTYQQVPFDVPDGITRLTLDLAYTGHEQRTTLDLGLWDPKRFRGWSGGNKTSITLSVSDATPSYLPGPIPAGRWNVVLGIPNIRPGVKSEFTIHVFFTRPGEDLPESAFAIEPINTGRGWYRGDLHLHTAHSDGSCSSQKGASVPCPVFKTLEAAAARGLDFIAITDHNTISQFEAMRELQPYFDRLLLIPGREITTFHGHANMFGPTAFLDFRVGSASVPDINTLLKAVQAEHGLFSINHPAAPSGESCMGCGWTAADTDFSLVQAVEVVNGGHSDDAYSGVPFWENLLRQGHRVTAIGGSDNHNGPKALDLPGSVGYPETVVHAVALSQKDILDAIRAGHVFLDLQGSKDRLLQFTAIRKGKEVAEMGDMLHLKAGESVTISMKAENVPGPVIIFLEDGHANSRGGESIEWTSDGNRHWLRAAVRSGNGDLVLLSNPIYVNY